MKFPPGQPLHMSIISSPSYLPVVRAAVAKMSELLGFDAQVTGRIVLSVDEALANIIKHAYDCAEDRPIEVELSPLAGGEGICIKLRDWGRHVDAANLRSRDLNDIRPGGLGVHIMNQCMDSVRYDAADGGGSVLTLVKHLSAKEAGAK